MKHERTVLPRTKKSAMVSVTVCGGGVQISALYTSTLLSVVFHKIMIL